MAITIVNPASTSRFFAHYNGSTMNTLNNSIRWTSTTNNNVTISYSKDNGSNWTVIETPVSSSSTGTNEYLWSLDSTENSDILGSVDEDTDMKIKIVDLVTADEDISDAFTLGKQPFVNIKPNGTNNSNGLYSHSIVQIVWDNLYDADIANVKIEFKLDSASWTTLIASTVNNGRYIFNPVDAPMSIAADVTSCLLRISGVDPSGCGLNIAVGYSENDDTDVTGFAIYIDTADVNSSLRPISHFPERKEIFGRLAVEKANLSDEAIALSQLEAGKGVKLDQRDKDGLDSSGKNRTGGTSADPYGAYNVIIKQDGYYPRERNKQGVLDFTSAGNPTATAKVAGDYYGSGYYHDIVHGWNLGSNSWLNEAGVNIYANQNKNSYKLEIVQVSSAGNPSIVNNVVPSYEAVDADTIRVYVTVKGTDVDPTADPATADSLVTLAKDRLAFDSGDYKFEYRLLEIIP